MPTSWKNATDTVGSLAFGGVLCKSYPCGLFGVRLIGQREPLQPAANSPYQTSDSSLPGEHIHTHTGFDGGHRRVISGDFVEHLLRKPLLFADALLLHNLLHFKVC